MVDVLKVSMTIKCQPSLFQLICLLKDSFFYSVNTISEESIGLKAGDEKTSELMFALIPLHETHR